jgi:hypothetical protein
VKLGVWPHHDVAPVGALGAAQYIGGSTHRGGQASYRSPALPGLHRVRL